MSGGRGARPPLPATMLAPVCPISGDPGEDRVFRV